METGKRNFLAAFPANRTSGAVKTDWTMGS